MVRVDTWDAVPDGPLDLSLRRLVPQATTYVHDSADHVRAHVLSALVGVSVSVPVRNSRLALGEFQRVVLLEFEGPRSRTVSVTTTHAN